MGASVSLGEVKRRVKLAHFQAVLEIVCCNLSGHLNLLRTKVTAPFALLCSSSEILATPLLDQDVAPSLVQYFLDAIRHVDDLEGRDNLVIFLNVAVVELVEPEAIGLLAKKVEAGNFGFVLDSAFAPKRC